MKAYSLVTYEIHYNSKRKYKFFLKDWVNLTDIDASAEVINAMRFSRNISPMLMNQPEKKNICVIAPHPDDEMIGPGGTILHALNNGASVTCIYLTSGKKNDIADDEAKTVSKKYGYNTVFMGNYSGEIEFSEESYEKLISEIIKIEPNVLFIPFLLDDHDEHRIVSQMLMHGYEISERNNKIDCFSSLEIWCYQVYTSVFPNVIVNITDVIAKKKDAVRGWESQFKNRDWAHYVEGLNAYNSRFLHTKGKKEYAEIFFVVPMKEYIDLCKIYFSKNNMPYYLDRYIKQYIEGKNEY